MYQPETILAKTEPFADDHPAQPYNRVKVIGQSPINHGLTDAQWEGAQGQGVIVQPLDGFGATLDEPYGKLRDLYEVEDVPEMVAETQATVRVIQQDQAGDSPEDQFRAAAKERGDETSQDGKRVRTPPPSPLDAVPETPEEAAEKAAVKEEIKREHPTGE